MKKSIIALTTLLAGCGSQTGFVPTDRTAMSAVPTTTYALADTMNAQTLPQGACNEQVAVGAGDSLALVSIASDSSQTGTITLYSQAGCSSGQIYQGLLGARETHTWNARKVRTGAVWAQFAGGSVNGTITLTLQVTTPIVIK